MRNFGLLLFLALAEPGLTFFQQSPNSSDDTTPTFDWTSINPSQNLEYHECYEKYKCARLKVPLDWNQPNPYNTSDWAALAIVALPAPVPEDDPSFGGTVLVNPGGPGGSGTLMALLQGEYLQTVVGGGSSGGKKNKKHYEILGFDPRGTQYSTPRADCYNSTLNRAANAIALEAIPPLSTGQLGLDYFQTAATAQSALCAESSARNILAHMSTASVARDMLEIVERVDELRNGKMGEEEEEEGCPSEAKLNYLGLSYGTFLGNTFASMFPDRVGRMVLDGVVDPESFVWGVSWPPLHPSISKHQKP